MSGWECPTSRCDFPLSLFFFLVYVSVCCLCHVPFSLHLTKWWCVPHLQKKTQIMSQQPVKKRVRESVDSPVVLLDTLPAPGSANDIPYDFINQFQTNAGNAVESTNAEMTLGVLEFQCDVCVTRNPVVAFSPEECTRFPSAAALVHSKTLAVIVADTDGPKFPGGGKLYCIDGVADWVDWTAVQDLVTRHGWRLLVSTDFAKHPRGVDKLDDILTAGHWKFSDFRRAKTINTNGDEMDKIIACPRVFTSLTPSIASKEKAVRARLPAAFAADCDATDAQLVAAVRSQLPTRRGGGSPSSSTIASAVAAARRQHANNITYIPRPVLDTPGNTLNPKTIAKTVVVNSATRLVSTSIDATTGRDVPADVAAAAVSQTNSSIATSLTLADYVSIADVNDFVTGKRGPGVFTSPASNCTGCGCACPEMNAHLTNAIGCDDDRVPMKFWACSACTPVLVEDEGALPAIMTAGRRARNGAGAVVPLVKSSTGGTETIQLHVARPESRRVVVCLYTGKIRTIDSEEFDDYQWAASMTSCLLASHSFSADLFGVRNFKDTTAVCTACVIDAILDGAACLCIGCQKPVTSSHEDATVFRNACLCDGAGRVVACRDCANAANRLGVVCDHPGCTNVVHEECGGRVFAPEDGSDEVANFAVCGAHVRRYARQVDTGHRRDVEFSVVGFTTCCMGSECDNHVDDPAADRRARVLALHDFHPAACRAACCTSDSRALPGTCRGLGVYYRDLFLADTVVDLSPWTPDGILPLDDVESVIEASIARRLGTRVVPPCGHVLKDAAIDGPEQYASCAGRTASCPSNPDMVAYIPERYIDLVSLPRATAARVHTLYLTFLPTETFTPLYSTEGDDNTTPINIDDIVTPYLEYCGLEMVGDGLVFFEARDIPTQCRDRVYRVNMTVRGKVDDVSDFIADINGLGITMTRTKAARGVDRMAFVQCTFPEHRLVVSAKCFDDVLVPTLYDSTVDPFADEDDNIIINQPGGDAPPVTPPRAGAGGAPPGDADTIVGTKAPAIGTQTGATTNRVGDKRPSPCR